MKIIAEGQWLKAETSSHDLRGLSIIADLYILGGVAVAGSGLLFFILGSVYAVMPIGFGVIMIAIGYYLDDLHRLSWWAVVISNLVALVLTSYSAIFLHTVAYDITFIINVALSVLCIGYLMRSNVRKLFF
jgi:uncharacterized integral membrane protein